MIPVQMLEDTITKLKENGIFEQYKKISDEDWEQIEKQEKRNKKKRLSVESKEEKDIRKVIVPGYFCSMASKLLRKYCFKQSYVGFEYWKHLIALMLHDNNYLSKSLNSDIYPYIADKCNSTVANVESQLRFSLNDAMDKGYTITSFLNKILNNEEKVCESKENVYESEEKNMNEKSKEMLDENTIVQVPAKILFDYYYMKGYIAGLNRDDLITIDIPETDELVK